MADLSTIIDSAGLSKHRDKLFEIFEEWGVEDGDDLKQMFEEDSDTCNAELKKLWSVKLKKVLGLSSNINNNNAQQQSADYVNDNSRLTQKKPDLNETRSDGMQQGTIGPVDNDVDSNNDDDPDDKIVASKTFQKTSKRGCRVKGVLIEAKQCNIATERTDAVVNAANDELMHGSGVAGALRQAAGSDFEMASLKWVAENGVVPRGGVAVTHAGLLPARVCVHAVGPTVRERVEARHKQQLRDCVRNALEAASAQQCATVTLPAISTGIFGFPKRLGTQIIVAECAKFAAQQRRAIVQHIKLCAIDAGTHKLFVAALNAHFEIGRSTDADDNDYAADDNNDAANDDDNDDDDDDDTQFEELPKNVSILTIKRLLNDSKQTIRAMGEHAKDDATLVQEVKGKNWELSLKKPQDPPPSPIETLQPSDVEYQQFVDSLPADQRARVVSVRRCNVPSRVADFNKTKKTLQSNGRLKKEVLPVYHGTPERWRATAIAINGFDLSIRLVGRALGDGVYSAQQVNTPLGYTKQVGSMLRMRGLQTDKTVVQNDWLVFKDPKQVLPVHIVDFAQSTSARDAAVQQQAEQLKKKKAEHDRLQREMTQREAAFRKATADNMRRALTYFTQRVQEFESQLEKLARNDDDDNDNDADDDDDDSASLARYKLYRRVKIEFQQFKALLPIYAQKAQVLSALKDNDVVVLLSETGSGKSTQIPQYLLDDVLPENDTRRIAVLQPRRVNATSLAERLCKERGGKVGDEVGYTLGLGDEKIAQGTRIEFMTHGLFAQMANHPMKLVENYAAVVLDEAHERSLEIDLSFGFIQRALAMLVRRRQKQKDMDESKKAPETFKVVVTSATIEGMADRFLRYLSVSKNLNCLKLQLQGTAFPTYIEHRAELQLPASEIGTGGVGRVLSKHAANVALELITRTESGNVLVFMPGSSSINTALKTFQLVLLNGKDADDDSSNSFGLDFFRALVSKKNKKTQRVVVYAFHGKVTTEQRHMALRPSKDRVVVLATNMAETGVTLPNIRYVIDTGLERRVRWNPDSDVREMVTEPVTQSSASQRAGRAGRTSSGICVRLFADVAKLKPHPPPLIKEGMILKLALRLLSLGDDAPQLLDDMSKDASERAVTILRQLGALDDKGKVSQIGDAMLKLGVDLRLSMFLLACNRVGCLKSGTALTAMISTGTYNSVLPSKRTLAARKVDEATFRSFVHESGDHLTLLNIFEAFRKHLKSGASWCRLNRFDYKVMLQAHKAFLHLADKLSKGLKYRVEDIEIKMNEQGGKDHALLRALCAAFPGHVAVLRRPGQPQHGLVRVLDDERKKKALGATSQFVAQQGPLQSNDNDYGATTPPASPVVLRSSSSSLNSSSSSVNSISGIGGNNDSEAIVRPSNTSVLSLNDNDKIVKITDENGNKKRATLCIFDSILITDAPRSGANPLVPSIELLSFVTPADVKAGAPEWCKDVKFDKLMQDNERQFKQFNLSPAMCSDLTRGGKASRLTKLRSKYKVADFQLDQEKGRLGVSAPAHLLPVISYRIEELMALGAEEIRIDLPKETHLVKFRKKLGELRGDLKTLVDTAIGVEDKDDRNNNDNNDNECDDKKEKEKNDQREKHDKSNVARNGEELVRVRWSEKEKWVKLDVKGDAKQLLGAMIGIVSSAIYDCIDDTKSLPVIKPQGTGAAAKDVNANPRLMQLATSKLPAIGTTRDQAAMLIAHVAVWQMRCCVYGGFVRDYIIRGKPLNDVDVLLTNNASAAQAAVQLTQLLAAHGLRVSTPLHGKGMAQTIAFAGQFVGKEIEVDLVTPAAAKQSDPPGVSADVDNMMIGARGQLMKKKPNAGGKYLPLAKCIAHCKASKFCYLYNPAQNTDQAKRRLKKLIVDRSFTCISPAFGALPGAVQQSLRGHGADKGFQPDARLADIQWWKL